MNKSIEEIVEELTLIQHPVVIALVGIYRGEEALLAVVPNMLAALRETPERFDGGESMQELIGRLEEYHARQGEWVKALESSLRELHEFSQAAIIFAMLGRDWERKLGGSSDN